VYIYDLIGSYSVYLLHTTGYIVSAALLLAYRGLRSQKGLQSQVGLLFLGP
jgi:hypothetical protein